MDLEDCVKALASSDREQQIAALDSLGGMANKGQDLTEAGSALFNAFSEGTGKVRAQSIWLLLSVSADFYRDGDLSVFEEALSDQSKYVREATSKVLMGLARTRGDLNNLETALKKATRVKGGQAPFWAGAGLVFLAMQSNDNEGVAAALKAKKQAVRAGAAWGVGVMEKDGHDVSVHLDTLATMLEDKGKTIRSNAISSLKGMAERGCDLSAVNVDLQTVLAFLSDRDAQMRKDGFDLSMAFIGTDPRKAKTWLPLVPEDPAPSPWSQITRLRNHCEALMSGS